MANPADAFISPVIGMAAIEQANAEARNAGLRAAEAEARANVAKEAAGRRTEEAYRNANGALSTAAVAVAMQRKMLEKKDRELESAKGDIAKANNELFEAKKALHGQVAVKNALKAALAEVAPQHPFLTNPEGSKSNPLLNEIAQQAKSKTKPEDPWWP